jgi:hypothetical protein
VPAAQAVEALLFLLELGEGELLLGDLALEFRVVLGAIAEEFDPLGLAGGCVLLGQARLGLLVAAVGVEE